MDHYAHYADTDLLSLLKVGDEVAFGLIYRKYWDKLFYIATKKLRNEGEAQEAVQDIFLKLWDNRARLQLRENLEHYLVSAVHYQIINRRQKAIRRAAIEQKLGKAADKEILASQLPDLSKEYFEQLQAKLDQAILNLPNKCQLVFKMSRSEEYTNKKIALELGISEKAVEKHITHALKVLRKNLGPTLLFLLLGEELLK